ncbi:MAG: DNA cytosine methyltransferase [Bryobacterales bacterium]|nr:DNA cytosine methyltransferase [Bryobacterales bacterium]
MRFTWLEFFAGGGMARLGLGDRWRCLLANEWDPKKAQAYRRKFGSGESLSCPELRVCDIATLTPGDIPAAPALAWASFPCQDLSLAGAGAGLRGERSGTFHALWRLLESCSEAGLAPSTIVLENVTGLLTSHEGRDFEFIISRLVSKGFAVGALVIDAIAFLPQSRPRLFIVATQPGSDAIQGISGNHPTVDWHPPALRKAFAALPLDLQQKWVWWDMPRPPYSELTLSDIVRDDGAGVRWHTRQETARLLGMMSDRNRAKLREAIASGHRHVGAVYRRTRPDGNGGRIQRAEIRFDGVSGCLRTPAGGSSRQIIVVVEGKRVRSRLITAQEAARLMGVEPSSYPIPERYNDAYHLFGDGLAVPAVSWLATHILCPLVRARYSSLAA